MSNIRPGVCKYPKEVFSALTSTKTLSVRGELTPASAEKGQSPYKVYDGVFSRFVFTIIQKDKNGRTTFPDGNIPVLEVPGIIENTRSAKVADTFLSLPVLNQFFLLAKETNNLIQRVGNGINMLYTLIRTGSVPAKQEEPAQEDMGKLAKSVQIRAGHYKGRTPYEILAENPEEADGLRKQHQWLESNLAKYPGNQQQMDAITEALHMLEKGLLHAEDGTVASVNQLRLGDVVLYEPLPKALIRKEDEQGFCPVYEIGIIWHIGDRYPIEVSVKNYKAPVERKGSGIINPIRTKAIDIVNNTFRMTSSQWFSCLHAMEAHMERFEMLNMKTQFQEAEMADRANRNAARAQAQAEQPPQTQPTQNTQAMGPQGNPSGQNNQQGYNAPPPQQGPPYAN